MLKEYILTIDNAIEEALDFIQSKNPTAYILLLGRADKISGLKKRVGTDCVIDYQLDRYYDETRTTFYVKYLKRNYSRELYSYDSSEGIYNLNLEIMMYSHVWASSSFFKIIYRMASIVKDGEYNWDVKMPDHGAYKLMEIRLLRH